MHSYPRALAAALLMMLVVVACGDSSGAVSVSDAWARPSAATQDSAAVYLTIRGGDGPDELVGVSVAGEIAGMARVHETTTDAAGTMSMSQVPSISVPGGESMTFEPGGLHVMLVNLVEPLQAGDAFTVALIFEDAGTIVVDVEVRPE